MLGERTVGWWGGGDQPHPLAGWWGGGDQLHPLAGWWGGGDQPHPLAGWWGGGDQPHPPARQEGAHLSNQEAQTLSPTLAWICKATCTASESFVKDVYTTKITFCRHSPFSTCSL